jgi:peptidoglycan/LPS O-acetylase OafA/YrhL
MHWCAADAVTEGRQMTPARQHKSSLNYRPDIDGLRGIAVLLVLVYHLGSSKCRGGFVGVDVFFVISGYLIGSIILSDISASTFSLLSFYERRVRRIAPALFVMLFVACLFVYKYFLPAESTDFAKSLLAATLSTSNIFFLHQSGYFDGPAAMKPLLHTWSLAVEEQFYIFLPLVLMAIRRYLAARQRALIIFVAALSFLVSAVGAFRSPDATFYLAHTRAWELLLGTLVTLDILPRMSSTLWRNAASFAGLALILTAGYAFDATTPFPGVAALMPCVGAALIIAAGRAGASLVGRFLALPPLVFVGMISYSLYLWHWPMIVFQGSSGLFAKGVSPKLAKLVVMGISLLVATLSWKFVEQPFRGRRFKISRIAVFRFAAVGAVVLLILGISIVATGGLPSRFPAEAVRVATFLETSDATTKRQYRVGTCFLTSKDEYESFNPSVCLQQDSHRRNDLLIGDSHAAQLWYGLSVAFPDVNILQATASGCKPTLEQNPAADRRCLRLMDYMYSHYLPTHHIDTLLIAARWDRADLQRLPRTIAAVKQRGIEVVLFGPIFQYDSALPRLLALSIKQNRPEIPADHRIAYYEQLDADMSRLAATQLRVRYISYFKLLCQKGSCLEYAAAGIPLQSDYGHLTGAGSILMAHRIRESGGLN